MHSHSFDPGRDAHSRDHTPDAGRSRRRAATDGLLQRKERSGDVEPPAAGQGLPASVLATLDTPGRPLDADTRAFMEPRFNRDFSAVRVHDDSAASRSADEVGAHAYTVGQDIVFAQGQYQPQDDAGRSLLAHELAHTLQQQGLQRSALSSLPPQSADYQQLEQQADRAASQVMAGGAVDVASLGRSGPQLACKKTTAPAPEVKPAATPAAQLVDDKDEEKPEFTARYKTDTFNREFTLTSSEVPVKVAGQVSASKGVYEVDKLILPALKGPEAEALCAKPYRPLKAVYKLEGSKAVPEKGSNIARDPTHTLRRNWLDKQGYKPGKDAEARWKAVGGLSPFPSVPNGPTAEVDHIQELQVGGDNGKENLQLLDKVDNGASGSLIQQQLANLALGAFADAKEVLGNKRPKKIELQFKGVSMQGSPKVGLAYQLGKRFADASITAETAMLVIDYELKVLGNSVKLKLPADNKKLVPLAGSSYAENLAASRAIKGLTLTAFERPDKGRGQEKVHFTLDAEIPNFKPKGKNAMSFPVAADGTVQLPSGNLRAPIQFEFTKLSPGRFTKLSLDANGVVAEGTIKPTVPLLPTLTVTMSGNSLKVSKGIDKDKIKPPFPGVKVTEASLGMELSPEFKPFGNLAFEFGGKQKLADLKLRAEADANGLVLLGDLFVFLPGVDNAKGEVSYRGGEWSGGAHIEASSIKLPYVKSGAIDLFFKGRKIDASGKVQLALPGGNEAELELKYTNAKWIFAGRGRFKVKSPYLKPIDASLWYDGELFIAKGKAGFAFAGLDGTVDATYENRDGRDKVYGKGDIKIDKGKAKGNIGVELQPSGKVTGKGKLSYEIKKDLVASAGITVDDNQRITFDGELSFPDIKLFERFPKNSEDNTIFKASGSIPIPGASIGPIGLKVKLWGSLGYYYYVGPGVLTGVKAAVRFNPFDDNPDFNFNLKAKASIPAGGGIRGKVGADVALDAYVAEVGGGLNVEARAGLEGKAELGGEIAYSKDKFSVDASAYVGGKVVLAADLNARVYAEAGVWKFKVRTEKTWKLAGGTFDTGLNLGVRLPLHYDNIEGFRMPRLADIKPEPANLDLSPSSMLSSLFGKAGSEEKEVG